MTPLACPVVTRPRVPAQALAVTPNRPRCAGPERVEELKLKWDQPYLGNAPVANAVDADGLPPDVLTAELGASLDQLHHRVSLREQRAAMHSHRHVRKPTTAREVRGELTDATMIARDRTRAWHAPDDLLVSSSSSTGSIGPLEYGSTE
jgi:hypothetical protein